MNHHQPVATVHLRVEQRGDSIYVSSDDMPGLWLWGPDPDVVFGDVPPAIEALYEHRYGGHVRAKPRTPKVRLGLGTVENVCHQYDIYPVDSQENSRVDGGRTLAR